MEISGELVILSLPLLSSSCINDFITQLFISAPPPTPGFLLHHVSMPSPPPRPRSIFIPASLSEQAALPLGSHSHCGGIHSRVWHQALLGEGEVGCGVGRGRVHRGSHVIECAFCLHGTLEFSRFVCSRVRKKEGK